MAAEGYRCLWLGVELERLRWPSLSRGMDGETPWLPHKKRIGPMTKVKMPVEIDSYR